MPCIYQDTSPYTMIPPADWLDCFPVLNPIPVGCYLRDARPDVLTDDVSTHSCLFSEGQVLELVLAQSLEMSLATYCLLLLVWPGISWRIWTMSRILFRLEFGGDMSNMPMAMGSSWADMLQWRKKSGPECLWLLRVPNAVLKDHRLDLENGSWPMMIHWGLNS